MQAAIRKKTPPPVDNTGPEPLGRQNVLYWHWSPEYGWEMDFPCGYNECLIMYILPPPALRMACPLLYTTKAGQNGAIVSPHKVGN